MVRRLELGGFKAIQRIARSVGPQRGSGSRSLRQQQGDQIRRALEQPVKPLVRFHDSPPDTGQPSNPTSSKYICTANHDFRVFTG
jgi:hypothetical protein